MDHMDIQVVYLEAILMPNDEVIHFGKSLGFINNQQRQLIESNLTKLTRGKEKVITLNNR